MFNAYRRHERVLLVAHTPFGINDNLLYKFYEIIYEQKLLAIIEQYASSIVMCFSGHRHQDTIRLYPSVNSPMGIIGHPSISPISALSQPSIRRYLYDRHSIVLIDYDQYALNLIESERTDHDRWSLAYRFSSWYRQTNDLTSDNLYRLIYLIRTQSFYRRRFLLARHHAETVVLTDHQIIQELCGLTLFDFDRFLLCTQTLERKNRQLKTIRTITMNNSWHTHIHEREQSMEYTTIYRWVAFVIVLIVVAVVVNRIYKVGFLPIFGNNS
jgi:hypothetical protein